MTNKSRNGKKNGKGGVKMDINGLQSGMSQHSITPPTIVNSTTSYVPPTMTNVNLPPSSLIRQSNKLLYGNTLQTSWLSQSSTASVQGPAPSIQPVMNPASAPQQAVMSQPWPSQQVHSMYHSQHYQPAQSAQPVYEDRAIASRCPAPQQEYHLQQQPQSCRPESEPQSPQLISLLQSLDTRMSKLENQLGHQNQQLSQHNNRIHNIESHVKQITFLKQNMSSIDNKSVHT